MTPARLAIVVPTLDEEDNLRRHLPHALAMADEVVVSDGGSRDATVRVAEELGARVVTGPPGRGGQLHRGALATTSEILLFLHADTQLPDGAADLVRRAIADGAEGGAFFVRFTEERPWVLRIGERLVNLRTRLTKLPLGDQAQFLRRGVYEELEGFESWPILEDLDMARRLRRRQRLALLWPPVRTSARRYLGRGILRTLVGNWLIWLLYAIGVSPHRLAGLYR
ncbi:MAG TPA: TIGR04283 family arsenosugar biosynthesis glycosyltransferase [Thermoanaerobaculia bacterium]|nr:TIGR04283 family arsenosugar biosynthesis glycosyltransferase [Thermoanaerobaculia bacterium]